jgi:putative hemolysin
VFVIGRWCNGCSMRSISQYAVRARIATRARVEGRYEVRLAETSAEVASALRLRHLVFNVELGGNTDVPDAIEFDEFDLRCRHLIVVCRDNGRTVGTYRLNTAETADPETGFYSSDEFTTETLPHEVLPKGIEIGRACIDKDHRNTKVLFLLWKGLLQFLLASRKQYFFGCCSIFTRDELAGALAYRKLEEAGQLSKRYRVLPRRDAVDVNAGAGGADIELPPLFEMYLRLGAEVCGPPMIDREFGTIDFFVVFDTTRMTEKYRRMFAR